MEPRYVKVMNGNCSSADSDINYKMNEINIAPYWNSMAENPKEMGGFNFSTEDKILRWLIRGDTIYDVEIPENAEVIDVENKSAPHGVFRSNQMIIKNPRLITDEMALYFYQISNLPEYSYYKALAGCAIRGYLKTCLQIIQDKVNKDNISFVLSEIEDFVRPENANTKGNTKVYHEVMELLQKIKE